MSRRDAWQPEVVPFRDRINSRLFEAEERILDVLYEAVIKALQSAGLEVKRGYCDHCKEQVVTANGAVLDRDGVKHACKRKKR